MKEEGRESVERTDRNKQTSKQASKQTNTSHTKTISKARDEKNKRGSRYQQRIEKKK